MFGSDCRWWMMCCATLWRHLSASTKYARYATIQASTTPRVCVYAYVYACWLYFMLQLCVLVYVSLLGCGLLHTDLATKAGAPYDYAHDVLPWQISGKMIVLQQLLTIWHGTVCLYLLFVSECVFLVLLLLMMLLLVLLLLVLLLLLSLSLLLSMSGFVFLAHYCCLHVICPLTIIPMVGMFLSVVLIGDVTGEKHRALLFAQTQQMLDLLEVFIEHQVHWVWHHVTYSICYNDVLQWCDVN